MMAPRQLPRSRDVPTIDETARALADDLLGRRAGGRLIAGIAGPPGSGKSTLAEALVAEIERRQPGLAAVLPMDGFHYDDAVLRELGRLPRKGAIDTFDAAGLVATLRRLKANDEPVVAVPVFDRSIEIARAGGRLIPNSVGIVVAEGNYLLVGEAPWSAIRPLLDVAVLVETPEDELRRRLTARWVAAGLPEAEIRRKVEENDLPNGRVVVDRSGEPDLRVRT
jgi:pantothenate kinase